jgi:phosphocarrier protein HPr
MNPSSRFFGRAIFARCLTPQIISKQGIPMLQKQLLIKNSVGLHARPASLFVQKAKKFKCSLRLLFGGRNVDAKSILSVLTLGVNEGAQVTLCAEGEDAAQAIEEISQLVESNFGETA